MAGLLCLVASMLAGCSRSSKSYEKMSESEQLVYLRAQAYNAMVAEASNNVPGIRNVLEVNADTLSDSVDKWNGWVRVNFASPSGGLELTNVQMTFIVTFDGRLFACGPSKLDAPVAENK
jgi:hypothetical protein